MLDRLPNEIILEIFNKTKTTTVQSCSLLNSRFLEIIKRDNLNVRLLDRIWLCNNGKSDFDMLLEFSDLTGFIYKHNSQDEQIQFLQTVLSKVQAHRWLEMTIFGLAIKKEFVDKILKHQVVRGLYRLVCNDCSLSNELIDVLMSMKLQSLKLVVRKGNEVTFSTEFFETVAEFFVYVSKDTTDFRHFDDKVLEMRLLNCKGSLHLINCITGLTEARREQLEQSKKYYGDGYSVVYYVGNHIPNKWDTILNDELSEKDKQFKLFQDSIDKSSSLSSKEKLQ